MEKASDPRSSSTAPPTTSQTQQSQNTSNELKGQDTVDEDNYQTWDSQQNRIDTNNNGDVDYQGYSGYEQEGDGYGDYSGGGNGNMVDVGGSTAIKEDGCVYNLLASLHIIKTFLLYLSSSTYLCMSLSLPSSLLEARGGLRLELALVWNAGLVMVGG